MINNIHNILILKKKELKRDKFIINPQKWKSKF
jgi:hypothetical protein